MPFIRRELIDATVHNIFHTIDFTDIDEWYELAKKTLYVDESLTNDENQNQ